MVFILTNEELKFFFSHHCYHINLLPPSLSSAPKIWIAIFFCHKKNVLVVTTTTLRDSLNRLYRRKDAWPFLVVPAERNAAPVPERRGSADQVTSLTGSGGENYKKEDLCYLAFWILMCFLGSWNYFQIILLRKHYQC